MDSPAGTGEAMVKVAVVWPAAGSATLTSSTISAGSTAVPLSSSRIVPVARRVLAPPSSAAPETLLILRKKVCVAPQ